MYMCKTNDEKALSYSHSPHIYVFFAISLYMYEESSYGDCVENLIDHTYPCLGRKND